MSYRSSRFDAAALLIALFACSITFGQIPDTFENLQVLPKEIGKPELIQTMRGFAQSLGVRCNHCHVGPDNLQGMDFAVDTKSTKKSARGMMKMVAAINDTHLPAALGEKPATVTCRTCHRGVSAPISTEAWLDARIAEQGLPAAIEAYRELRTEHYGSAAYDFSSRPLNELAQTLAASGETETGLSLVNLNLEFYPEDLSSHVLLGSIHGARGEIDKAKAAYKAALALDPDNPWIARQLANLDPKPEP